MKERILPDQWPSPFGFMLPVRLLKLFKNKENKTKDFINYSLNKFHCHI